MKPVLRAVRLLLFAIVCVAVLWFVVTNYSFVFSKKVKGQVVNVERVVEPTAILGRGLPAEQVYSYSVMIRAEDGTIYTSSSEDRQWAVVKKGYCVEARFYPYPPWDFEKGYTYHNARLLKVLDCSQMKLHGDPFQQDREPTPSPTAAESASE